MSGFGTGSSFGGFGSNNNQQQQNTGFGSTGFGNTSGNTGFGSTPLFGSTSNTGNTFGSSSGGFGTGGVTQFWISLGEDGSDLRLIMLWMKMITRQHG
ncbi:hypothetical protein FQN49_005435 [Arthroderma sp. PD_2]|nr:hypothetical protein FQN49_005435 [Arthroderma sp. PD_2]